MSLSLAIGMAETIFNGHRGVQAAGLTAAFAAGVAINPAIGLVTGLLALGGARLIGRGEQNIDTVAEIMADHRAQKPGNTPKNTGP